jgi:hypothetical protein
MATALKTGVDRTLLFVEVIAGIGVVAAIIGKNYGLVPTIFFLFCGLTAAFAVYSVVKAALAWGDPTLDLTHQVRDEERERLEHEKMLLLQGIKELETDLSIGKVDQRDYAHLRRTAENRAIAIIERLKDTDAHWMRRAEQLVSTRLGVTGMASMAAAGHAAGTPVLSISWFSIHSEEAKREHADARAFDERPVTLDESCSGCGAAAVPEALYCTGCGRPRS